MTSLTWNRGACCLPSSTNSVDLVANDYASQWYGMVANAMVWYGMVWYVSQWLRCKTVLGGESCFGGFYVLALGSFAALPHINMCVITLTSISLCVGFLDTKSWITYKKGCWNPQHESTLKRGQYFSVTSIAKMFFQYWVIWRCFVWRSSDD